MHIPDGYLGPPTCAAAFAVMIPVWAVAARKARQSLQARQAPLLAVSAAFSFVVMMINIPIPGGTTGHAVGSALAAMLLGPWAACIAVSVALAIQALLFGDGGITAFGANSFNMAFVMSFVGYAVFRLFKGRGDSPARVALAAGAAGYLALVSSAICTGIEFGIQPFLHHTASGRALYCPYPLRVALPAMAGSHLLLFGWIEAAITALVVRFLQKHEPALLSTSIAPARRRTARLLLGAVAVLVVLTPLGIFLPKWFHAGTAWGEWDSGEVNRLAGYAPKGLVRLSSIWNAPMPDYAQPGAGQSAGSGIVSYAASALVGIAVIGAVFFLLVKFAGRRRAGKREPLAGFIDRSIGSVVSVLRESLLNEESASGGGFLQQSDPRMKLIAIVLLLLSVLATRSITVLALLYLLCLILTAASKISVAKFLKRTLPFIPLFSLFIAIPAVFITPGRVIAAISLFSVNLQVTAQGVQTAALFFMRVLVSVSLATLLVLSTHHHALLKTLRLFKIPRLFVMTMGMSYRYILLLLDVVRNMLLGIRSRVGYIASAQDGRRIAATNMAGLWVRSYRLQSQVYDAMVSRGYAGEPVVAHRFRIRGGDLLVAGSSLFILIGTLWLNRFFR